MVPHMIRLEKVFVRGYLINYAKALDLDNTDLMELLNAVYIARDNQDTPQGKGGKKSKDSKINAQKPIHGYNLQDIENNDSLPLAKIIPPLLITLVCNRWRLILAICQHPRNNFNKPAGKCSTN